MKRMIAFLVLLAIGVLAMKFAIGDDIAVRANGNEPTSAKKRKPLPTRPPGVAMGQGSTGASVTQSGPLLLPRWRQIDIGGGHIRKEEVFILKAKDSLPLGEGLQHLIGVTLKLFSDGVHSATISASEAFIELGQDDNGNPTINAEKEINVRDTVITTQPDSKMAGLWLDLGDARINVQDNETQLRTDPDQAVTMTLAGDRPATLTGKGAEARLLRDQDGVLQRASITLQSDPILTTEGLTVTATGRLYYVENAVSGAAQITLDDNVELDLSNSTLALTGTGAGKDAAEAKRTTGQATRRQATRPTKRQATRPTRRQATKQTTVRGDQFTGWMLRSEQTIKDRDRNERSSMAWQRLVLVGAPATIDALGIHVATPRITVRPGPLGDPYIVTAHGGASRIEQTDLQPGSKQEAPVVGTSNQPIHLIRPANAAGVLHRSFGFPQWTLRSLEQQQIVIFEGSARLASGTRTIDASDGLMIVRRLQGETGIVQGFGDIEVHDRGTSDKPGDEPRPNLTAIGSDGMLLTHSNDREHLRLGPVMDERTSRWREHRYSMNYGQAKVRGIGACTVTTAQEHATIELHAPFQEIEADFGSEGTELRNVRQLRATIDGDRIVELDVGGLPAKVTLLSDGEKLLAQAPRIRQIGPRSLRLLPMDLDESPWSEMPELDRTPRLLRTWNGARSGGVMLEHTVEVVGPRIDIHHAGGRSAIVDAHADGEDLPRIYAKLPQSGVSEAATVTCAAKRLRILPFVFSPDVRRMHLGGTTGIISDITFHSLARPWLLVDGVHDFQLDDEKQGHISGTGHRLFVNLGAKSVLFVGDADAQTPATVTRTHAGRTVVMQGARVRVRNDDQVRLSALGSFEDRSMFLSPTMTLHEPGGSGLLAHMQAVCLGDIHVDPDAVRFGGPVEAFGLAPDGTYDADGLHIDAAELIMHRRLETGEVSLVKGKDVVINWTRLNAQAADIELDLMTSRCIARDPKGALVTLPDGRRLRSVYIAVNYMTWSFSTGPGRAVQHSTQPLETGASGEEPAGSETPGNQQTPSNQQAPSNQQGGQE